MDGRRRWVLFHTLLLMLAFVGTAGAQDQRLRGDQIGEVYATLAHDFAADRNDHDLGPSLLRFLYSALEQMSGVPVDDDERFRVCVDLVGTGGHPRLDGGGNLLGEVQFPFDFMETRSEVDQLPPLFDADFVIIDEFELVALAVSLHMRVHRGEPLFVAEDLVSSFLWPALYGFRLDLSAPRAPAATDVPHGHLVALHALAHVAPGAEVLSVVLVDEHHLEVQIQHLDGKIVGLHFVDVEFDDVATIQNALTTHGRATSERPRFVVMSWGLVDCALSSRYAAQPSAAGAAQFNTLAGYLTAALAASTDTGLEELLRGLCLGHEAPIQASFGDDFTCADATPEELALIGTMGVFAEVDVRSEDTVGWSPPMDGTRFFAAAGNQALGFAMPPAAWPEVVAVEACVAPEDGSRDDRFSNRGRGVPRYPAARALGAWFASPEPTDGRTPGSDWFGYWGTSFAAPAAAFYAAFGPDGRGGSHDPEEANWCYAP